jgi:phytoene dehydrogenase-like protein
MSRVVVIGGGFNGLVAAAWLARRKHKPVVLEQADTVGGAATTAEIAPGFRTPELSHAMGPVHPDVIKALGLDRAPVEWITPNPSLTVLGRDRRTLVFHRDPVLTAGSINQLSGNDAARWREFLQTTHRLASVVGTLNRLAPPPLGGGSSGNSTRAGVGTDWWQLLRVGHRARRLGSRDLARLARWLPMPVADLASEWFEMDLLQSALAARALFGNFAGPRSAGTAAVLLQRMAEDPMPVGSGVTARGGPGAVSAAVATIAERAGASIRTSTRVDRVLVRDGRVRGVVLAGGEEIDATAVVSAIDPRRTLLDLIDPEDLDSTVRDRAQRIRARGVTAKINLALSGLPAFDALESDAVPLRGRLLIADDLDYLERAFDAAKYGDVSEAPWLELTLPSVTDPSLAADGHHVLSIYAHFAPRRLRHAGWPAAADTLYRAVMRALEPHVRGLESLVIARQVLTPEDLERRLGASNGHVFHGEPALDQSWIARPLLGWGRYQGPIGGLFFASAGTHPGGGLTGLSGLLAGKTVDRVIRK